jgi:hypothetical protein
MMDYRVWSIDHKSGVAFTAFWTVVIVGVAVVLAALN